jgi:hypothetical protein
VFLLLTLPSGCFSSSSLVWCESSDMKPFVPSSFSSEVCVVLLIHKFWF